MSPSLDSSEQVVLAVECACNCRDCACDLRCVYSLHLSADVITALSLPFNCVTLPACPALLAVNVFRVNFVNLVTVWGYMPTSSIAESSSVCMQVAVYKG